MNEQPHQPIHQPYTASTKPYKPRKSHKKIILIVAIALVVSALATLVIFQQLKINSQDADQAARTVQSEVAKIMVIPAENALVSDIESADDVKSQPFFSFAENGDKVLVFASAAKIIIYRPSTHQIVNAGPIVDDTATIDENVSNE